jgi:hypothetical protein
MKATNTEATEPEEIIEVSEPEEIIPDTTEPEAAEEPSQKNNLVDRYRDEKQKRKELERRLRDLEDKSNSFEDKERVDKIRGLVKERGYDDDVANLMGDLFNEITKTIPKVDRVEQEILDDIEDYAEENPEVLKFKKEIVEKVKRYRKVDPDFGVEHALNLIKPVKLRYGEIKTDIEQKQAIARKSVENKKVAVSSSSESPKNPYPLDEADKKALEGLQRAQPDKNWTAEKYFTRMKNELKT